MSDFLSPGVRDVVQAAGYELVDAVTGPPVARPSAGASPPFPRSGRGGTDPVPFELHGLATAPEPWRVVATLAGGLRRGRAVAFVPRGSGSAGVGDRIVDVLGTPAGVESETGGGARTFYASPDRVHLEEGGLALYRTGSGSPTWREHPADGDDRRLVLTAGDRTVAVLDGVDALRCPGPPRAAFPLSYRREDRQFVVRDRDGRRVGTFAGVRAMRDRGFAPVPAPVVPELEFPEPGGSASGDTAGDRPSPSNAWAVLDRDGGAVRTAAGTRSLGTDR